MPVGWIIEGGRDLDLLPGYFYSWVVRHLMASLPPPHPTQLQVCSFVWEIDPWCKLWLKSSTNCSMYTLFCTIVITILGFRMIFEQRPNLKVQPECKISAHSRKELYSINITSLLWACNYRLCHKVFEYLVKRTSCYKLHWLHFRFCISCLLLCTVEFFLEGQLFMLFGLSRIRWGWCFFAGNTWVKTDILASLAEFRLQCIAVW